MLHVSVTALFFLIVPYASAGTIYKCQGPAGALLYQEAPCAKDVQSVTSWQSHNGSAVESTDDNSSSTLIIGQGRGGHYFIDGSINDHYLNFLVDTGASLVAIPQSMANDIGLRCQSLSSMQTANGITNTCSTTIPKLTFGHFTLRYVEAVVVPNLNQPLLGMNVLKRFRVEQDGTQMRISKIY